MRERRPIVYILTTHRNFTTIINDESSLPRRIISNGIEYFFDDVKEKNKLDLLEVKNNFLFNLEIKI